MSVRVCSYIIPSRQAAAFRTAQVRLWCRLLLSSYAAFYIHYYNLIIESQSWLRSCCSLCALLVQGLSCKWILQGSHPTRLLDICWADGPEIKPKKVPRRKTWNQVNRIGCMNCHLVLSLKLVLANNDALEPFHPCALLHLLSRGSLRFPFYNGYWNELQICFQNRS